MVYLNLPIIFLLKGFLIGLLLSLPVGPIAILCIRRSLTRGWIYGIFSGLGASTADSIYGAIAAFGLTFIDTFLLKYQLLLRFFGGIFLCYLGGHIYFTKLHPTASSQSVTGIIASYFSTLLLTLSNPMILLAFAVVLATFGLEETIDTKAAGTMLISGIFAGSALWWFILSTVAHFLRNKITVHVLERINKISAIAIIIFGILTLSSLLVPSLLPFI